MAPANLVRIRWTCFIAFILVYKMTTGKADLLHGILRAALTAANALLWTAFARFSAGQVGITAFAGCKRMRRTIKFRKATLS